MIVAGAIISAIGMLVGSLVIRNALIKIKKNEVT